MNALQTLRVPKTLVLKMSKSSFVLYGVNMSGEL
jgi:hypothetical protein